MDTNMITTQNEQEQALLDYFIERPDASLAEALATIGIQDADEDMLALWGYLKLQSSSIPSKQPKYRVKEVVFDG